MTPPGLTKSDRDLFGVSILLVLVGAALAYIAVNRSPQPPPPIYTDAVARPPCPCSERST